MQTPQYITDALRRMGTDLLTGQPLWRIVWSGHETRWHYGERVPRYDPDRPRWVLETYRPAAFYGPREAWGALRDPETGEEPIGPFPERGGYEPSFVFEWQGEFMPLALDHVLLLCRAIERGRLGSKSDTLLALRAAAEKARRDRIARLDALCRELGPVHGTATVDRTPGGGPAAKIEFLPAAQIPRVVRSVNDFAQLAPTAAERAALEERDEHVRE